MAAGKILPETDPNETHGQVCQFLSSLIAYDGQNAVRALQRAPFFGQLMTRLKDWQQRYPIGLAGTTSARCLDMLELNSVNAMMMQFMMKQMQHILEKGVTYCAQDDCEVKENLMQCAK